MNVKEFNKKLLEDWTDGFVIVPINDGVGYAKGDENGYESTSPSEWAKWHLNLRDVIFAKRVTIEPPKFSESHLKRMGIEKAKGAW